MDIPQIGRLNLKTPAEVAEACIPAISRNRKVIERQLRGGRFPRGVAVKVASRWFINVDALVRWVAEGGDLAAAPVTATRCGSDVAETGGER